MERNGVVTAGGKPVTLVGPEIKVGDTAPNFTGVDTLMREVSLSAFKDRVVVISSVLSLDTSVCDRETKRFNRIATELGPEVQVLTVSMDLPFAQKRWCGAAEVDRLLTLSDHRTADFGLKYGLLIREMRLLARAVYVIDQEGVVRYREVTPDTGREPNYPAAIDAIRDLLGDPARRLRAAI
jgi:thioredoxin-dependent peroxiredoxin